MQETGMNDAELAIAMVDVMKQISDGIKKYGGPPSDVRLPPEFFIRLAEPFIEKHHPNPPKGAIKH